MRQEVTNIDLHIVVPPSHNENNRIVRRCKEAYPGLTIGVTVQTGDELSCKRAEGPQLWHDGNLLLSVDTRNEGESFLQKIGEITSGQSQGASQPAQMS